MTTKFQHDTTLRKESTTLRLDVGSRLIFGRLSRAKDSFDSFGNNWEMDGSGLDSWTYPIHHLARPSRLYRTADTGISGICPLTQTPAVNGNAASVSKAWSLGSHSRERQSWLRKYLPKSQALGFYSAVQKVAKEPLCLPPSWISLTIYNNARHNLNPWTRTAQPVRGGHRNTTRYR